MPAWVLAGRLHVGLLGGQYTLECKPGNDGHQQVARKCAYKEPR